MESYCRSAVAIFCRRPRWQRPRGQSGQHLIGDATRLPSPRYAIGSFRNHSTNQEAQRRHGSVALDERWNARPATRKARPPGITK